MSRLQFLEVGSLILRVLSVKVSILEVGSWILRFARCSVCVCHFLEVGSWILRVARCQGFNFWRWGH